MKFIRSMIYIELIAILTFLAHNFPRTPSYPRQPTSTLIHMAISHGYTYFGTGERPDGSAASLYLNHDDNQWLLMSHDHNMNSCVTDLGTNWSWAIGITPL